MRNLLTRAVFDRTFKAGEKFYEPDLARLPASYLYADSSGYNFMDQASFETLTLDADTVGDDRFLLADNVMVQIQTYNGRPIAIQFPPHVELTVTSTEAGARGDTASGSVTKVADPRNRHGDPRAALHQGRREDQGPHRDAGVRRPRLTATTFNRGDRRARREIVRSCLCGLSDLCG